MSKPESETGISQLIEDITPLLVEMGKLRLQMAQDFEKYLRAHHEEVMALPVALGVEVQEYNEEHFVGRYKQFQISTNHGGTSWGVDRNHPDANKNEDGFESGAYQIIRYHFDHSQEYHEWMKADRAFWDEQHAKWKDEENAEKRQQELVYLAFVWGIHH